MLAWPCRASAVLVAAAVCLALAAPLAAAESLALPTDPQQWINSPPITLETLKGKAVILYFYEEGCPKCRAQWKDLVQLSKSYDGKPVLFVAVNSGNSRANVESYLRAQSIPWPTIVDSNRALEKAALDGSEVSLSNIMQLRMVLGNGQLTPGDWSNWKASVDRALATASWTTDPTTVPPTLLPAWQAVEFGNYPAGAALIKKSLRGGPDDVKAAAEKLQAVVLAKLDALLSEADAAKSAGDEWTAYKKYVNALDKFRGYDLPPAVATAKKELEANADVKANIQGQKALDGVQKMFAKAVNVNQQKVAFQKLQQIPNDFPGTEAAKLAEGYIAEAKAANGGAAME